MVKKSDVVRTAVRTRDWKKALRIAKGFLIGFSKEDRDKMCRAYECMVHPEFYRQIGTDIDAAIADGIGIVSSVYGERSC